MHDKLLDTAEEKITELLSELRPELLAAYGNVEFDQKSDDTVVTSLDKSVEERLREVLLSVDNSVGILGEEYGQEGSTSTYWLVDPIDGTEQFVRGMPTCKHLLALISDGEIIWSYMNLFVKGELWTARANQGTFCNGNKIEMRYRPLERAWIETSVDTRNPENVEILKNVREHIKGFTITREISWVAEGKLDGHLSLGAGGGPWDYAPRALLYREAGAKIANIGSDTYDFNNNDYLVAHERNFDQLMRLATLG